MSETKEFKEAPKSFVKAAMEISKSRRKQLLKFFGKAITVAVLAYVLWRFYLVGLFFGESLLGFDVSSLSPFDTPSVDTSPESRLDTQVSDGYQESNFKGNYVLTGEEETWFNNFSKMSCTGLTATIANMARNIEGMYAQNNYREYDVLIQATEHRMEIAGMALRDKMENGLC